MGRQAPVAQPLSLPNLSPLWSNGCARQIGRNIRCYDRQIENLDMKLFAGRTDRLEIETTVMPQTKRQRVLVVGEVRPLLRMSSLRSSRMAS